MNMGISLLDKIPVRKLGLKVQALLPSDSHSELVSDIDFSLLLYDKSLINTTNGNTAQISPQGEEHFFDAMARTARTLQLQTEKDRLLLLLPTNDFIATAFNMNVGGEKLVRSALELQSHSLIPAYDEDLLLAVNPRNQEGVALWFNEGETNRLFRAFEKKGLFLSAIMPRSLALVEPQSDEARVVLINDEEGETLSFLQVKGDSILRLLTVNKADLEQDVFAKQWELETGQLKGEVVKNMTIMEDWQALNRVVEPLAEYCFFPAGAVEEEKRISFARKTRIGGVVAACLVLLIFAPFISNWLTIRDLQNELERVQEMTAEPRRLQASIFDMDEEWGAMEEYPEQDVANVLISLNQVIQSSLTSFSINKGVIDITGSTDDPAYLVELLAEKEEFYNVGQSTNTRGGGSQFGIRMNLSSVDFDAYEEKYPPLSQGRQQ